MSKVDRLRSVRFKLCISHPYLATAVWALQLIECDASELVMCNSNGEKIAEVPMGVDAKWRCYYDPKEVDKWSVDKMSTALLHEINHLIRDHHARAASIMALPNIYNLAADAEINDDLLAEGCKEMDGMFFPKNIPPVNNVYAKDGELAEHYYDLLMQYMEQNDSKAAPQPQGVGNGACGSCAHGGKEDYEGEGEGEEGEGEGDVPTGVSESEAKYLRRQIAKEVEQHARQHGQGTVPEHYTRWASKELEPPQVAWQKLVQGAVRRSIAYIRGMVDYTYSRPSRRSSACPRIVLPSMYKPVPDVAVVVDTSGSMGSKELNLAMAEVNGILKAAGATDIRVMSCDADIHTDRRVRTLGEVKLGGGGGTDMGVALNVLTNGPKRSRPHIAIVLTDGYTPWPRTAPPYKVIVGVVNGTMSGVPKWVKAIPIGATKLTGQGEW